MQPIDPPVGGGRLRLLGLYHGLGEDVSARYIGSYDWQGEKYRRHTLTPSLEEIDVPLSDEQHKAAQQLKEKAGGKTAIDIAFPRLAHLSPHYIAEVRKTIDWADVVVFSHPWVFPAVCDFLKPDQLVVYDSHNVEGFLRAQLLDEGNSVEQQLLRDVVLSEYQMGLRADLVLACSHEDREIFGRIYNWPLRKIRVVPNGVMANLITVPGRDEKRRLKSKLQLPQNKKAAIFIGSNYAPNVEAACFISKQLAPVMPEIVFIIAGSVGGGMIAPFTKNIRITGFIDEESKINWLRACDFAINPMFSGSGTNIKMFDFMAAGLPVITTAVGARGIATANLQPFIVTEPAAEKFCSAIKILTSSQDAISLCGAEARACVEEMYSWERISPRLGNLFKVWSPVYSRRPPFLSVVIPTYERHEHLYKLMQKIAEQTFKDFEVIIVDQSKNLWPYSGETYDFCLRYYHTSLKGAVKARNTGCFYAQGKVIAFIDDDCLPDSDWLKNARGYFQQPNVIGVEGLINSDKLYDPNFRTVTNVGFEGLGFMTANLFIKSEVFNALNGFDECFDNPHFREDTDLGWRALKYGDIPFARDVRVFHPPHPRLIQRECAEERNRFFEKDALLLKKHPERYKKLFFSECQWEKPGFKENFLKGCEKYGVDVPNYIAEVFNLNS